MHYCIDTTKAISNPLLCSVLLLHTYYICTSTRHHGTRSKERVLCHCTLCPFASFTSVPFYHFHNLALLPVSQHYWQLIFTDLIYCIYTYSKNVNFP